MTVEPQEELSVVYERDLPHPPEKVWRALTEPHLIREWLMDNAFEPTIGHRFEFSADWGKVRCEVIAVNPRTSLSYSWGDDRLKSVVTWTLTPKDRGTRLRVEQTGFAGSPQRYHEGAKAGWPRFLSRLVLTLAGLD